jgi:chemotaxis protein MotA
MASSIKRKPDWTSWIGLFIGAAGIIGGLLLEGGDLRELMQHTAAIIVLGGTLGATMVTTPKRVLKNAAGKLGEIFFEPVLSPQETLEDIVALATHARKGGLISLESEAERIEDPFLRKAISLAIDGTNVKELRQMMELDMHLEQQHYQDAAYVFASAGGYAPTIGIIGAVLGLMQVMKNLANIAEVGHGIATAFVATVYGVASANILLLPAGSKLMARYQAKRQLREMALLGVTAILEGMNPKLIRLKLEAFTQHWDNGQKTASVESAPIASASVQALGD